MNHNIGYMNLKLNELSLSFSFPVVHISSLKMVQCKGRNMLSV